MDSAEGHDQWRESSVTEDANSSAARNTNTNRNAYTFASSASCCSCAPKARRSRGQANGHSKTPVQAASIGSASSNGVRRTATEILRRHVRGRFTSEPENRDYGER